MMIMMVEIIDADEGLIFYKNGVFVGSLDCVFDSDGWSYTPQIIRLLKTLGFDVHFYGPGRYASVEYDDLLLEVRTKHAARNSESS